MTTGVGAVLNRAKVKKGETVVVIGAGGVGLSVIMGAKLQGASKIICIDQNKNTKKLAMELGATDFFIPANNQDAHNKIIDVTSVGADHVFEAVGKNANNEISNQELTQIEKKAINKLRGIDGIGYLRELLV